MVINELKNCEELEGKDFRNPRKLAARSYYLLAEFSYNKGNMLDALDYLSTSLKYVRENPEVFFLMSESYRDQRNDLMAKDYLPKALLLTSNLAKRSDVIKLGYSLGITIASDWVNFLKKIGVKGWLQPVTSPK